MRFALDQTGYKYRPLRLTLDGTGRLTTRGWDVYALQTSIDGIENDGIFGPATDRAVRNVQRLLKLESDGIAGVLTQRALALVHLWPAQTQYDTPGGLARGQLEAEASFILGNHTPVYEIDQKMDLGVAMQHRAQTDTAALECFHVPHAIQTLVKHLHDYHLRYAAVLDEDDRQAWELAAGAWNAPSWTDIEAGVVEGTLTQRQRDALWAYIRRVTPYYL